MVLNLVISLRTVNSTLFYVGKICLSDLKEACRELNVSEETVSEYEALTAYRTLVDIVSYFVTLLSLYNVSIIVNIFRRELIPKIDQVIGSIYRR